MALHRQGWLVMAQVPPAAPIMCSSSSAITGIRSAPGYSNVWKPLTSSGRVQWQGLMGSAVPAPRPGMSMWPMAMDEQRAAVGVADGRYLRDVEPAPFQLHVACLVIHWYAAPVRI